MAFPAGYLERLGGKKDLRVLCDLVQAREISCIVVGLPIHMDGRPGKAAESARAFARALEKATERPVEMMDERWTSVEAERSLREAPRAKKREKGNVDAIAATLLLRTWLAQQQAKRA
jgi:putative Holliday junction resolvase